MKVATVALIVMALTPPTVWANQRASGFCQQGAKAVVTQGLSSTTKVQASYPSCTVTVYLTGTTTLATIYSDNSSTPLANPFTADSNGWWFFYAGNGRFDVKLSGGGLASPWTIGDVLFNDPAAGGTVTSVTAGAGMTVSQPTGAVTVTNAGVLSAFGRTGTVAAASNDYSWSQIGGSKQGSTNVPQMAGTNNGMAGALLCDDASGNATTVGCSVSAVTSFNGRTGAVNPQNGDYNASQVTNAAQVNGVNVFTLGNTFSGNVTFGAIITSNGTNQWNGQQTFAGTNIYNGSGIWTTGVQDFRSVTHSLPARTGLNLSKPATCTVGEMYFATDVVAGQNFFYCTATDTWTQQLNSGGGGGGATTFDLIGTGTNTTATMTVGAGATFKTASTAVVDFRAAGHTLPALTGTAASKPGTCTVGEMYFASDATAGQNWYFCTSANTWTQQLNGAGGSGFSSISGGTNTGAAMVVGSGASIATTGTGTITSTSLVDANQFAVVRVATVGGADDYLEVAPGTGNVHWQAKGADADIDMFLLAKGTGKVYLASSGGYFDNAGNLTVTSCTGCGGGGSSPPFADNSALVKNSSDNTKLGIFSLGNLTTGTTRTFSMQNATYTVAGLETQQAFTAQQTFNAAAVFSSGGSFIPVTVSMNSAISPAISVNNTGGYYGILDSSTGGSFFNSTVFFGGTSVYAQNSGFNANNWSVTSSTGRVGKYNAENTAGIGQPYLVYSNSVGYAPGVGSVVIAPFGSLAAGQYRVNVAPTVQNGLGAAGRTDVYVYFIDSSSSGSLNIANCNFVDATYGSYPAIRLIPVSASGAGTSPVPANPCTFYTNGGTGGSPSFTGIEFYLSTTTAWTGGASFALRITIERLL